VSGTTSGRIGEFGTLRSYPAGMQLIGQGEAARDVYLIQQGAMKLLWSDAEGRETIIGLRWPGSFVGASSVITALHSPATAITLVPCTLEHIPSERFLQILRSNAAFAMRIHEAQSSEIIQQMSGLGELAIASAKTRFMSFLERLASSVCDDICLPDGRLRLPLKKKELAAVLAITPEHFSRMLNDLTSEGVIATNGQWIVVRNFPELNRRASIG